MAASIKIYVIIVTYNGIRWVDACLGSLRNSTVALRTVIVDNGSTDGTPQRIAEQFPEVHLIRSGENLGFGRGNNAGIRYAMEQGATHFFLLNQDAWIYPDTIECLLACEDDRTGILSPVHLDGTAQRLDDGFRGYVFGNDANRKAQEGTPAQQPDTTTQHSHPAQSLDTPTIQTSITPPDAQLLARLTSPKEVDFVNAAAWLLPLRTIEAVGGFDPFFYHYGEDNNYCQRVLNQSLTIRVVPGALVCHDRQSAQRPLRNAWFGRYLLIAYCDPRRSVWQATRQTLSRQGEMLARLPYYLLRGDRKNAAAITDAYRTLLRRRKELIRSKQTNAARGAHWL